jgi:hypothetical protein
VVRGCAATGAIDSPMNNAIHFRMPVGRTSEPSDL